VALANHLEKIQRSTSSPACFLACLLPHLPASSPACSLACLPPCAGVPNAPNRSRPPFVILILIAIAIVKHNVQPDHRASFPPAEKLQIDSRLCISQQTI
jgi:hypothetical protein